MSSNGHQICVEWPSNPQGFDVPIYVYHNSSDQYVWYGADCSMYDIGDALFCNTSQTFGEGQYTAEAYNKITGVDTLSQRKRMAYFKSCSITMNTQPAKD